jgi:1,4-dihydroxy-2-naphthoate octaprenyltransferase
VEHGQVRAILGRHANPSLAATDPTLLVPAGVLRRSVEGLPPAEQRRLALDYAALWRRTFRTLARHLRGRPERALALFAEEVYPFLRGDRRAARVERAGARGARVLLADDLPAAYLCGLLEGFVGLSGAEAVARADGAGAFTVTFRVAAADRAARLAQQLAALRLPLLACALLAALIGVGVAGSAASDQPLPLVSILAVLAGTLGAQAGANALHSLRRAGGANPLRPAPSRALMGGVAAAGYLVALAALVLLGLERPGVAFALGALGALGLALGLAYARVRAGGLGPAVAGLTYGVLVPAGAAFALGGPWLQAVLVSLPLGLLAAALLLVDNLADRPLDEAGGQRTLAVRLPARTAVWAYALLAVGAVVLLPPALARPLTVDLAPPPAVALAIPAALLVVQVRRHADDPPALGAARLGTLALLLLVGALCAAATQVFLGAVM